jgi:hypothetical protein
MLSALFGSVVRWLGISRVRAPHTLAIDKTVQFAAQLCRIRAADVPFSVELLTSITPTANDVRLTVSGRTGNVVPVLPKARYQDAVMAWPRLASDFWISIKAVPHLLHFYPARARRQGPVLTTALESANI